MAPGAGPGPSQVWEERKSDKQNPGVRSDWSDPSAGTNLKSADSITMC